MSVLDLKENVNNNPSILYMDLVKQFLMKNNFLQNYSSKREILVDYDVDDKYLDFKKPERLFIVFNQKDCVKLHFRILSFRTMNEIGWKHEWKIINDKLSGKGLRSLTLKKIMDYEHFR